MLAFKAIRRILHLISPFRWLGMLPPGIFVAAYVFCVFWFADQYATMKGQFYAPYAKLEPSALADQREVVRLVMVHLQATTNCGPSASDGARSGPYKVEHAVISSVKNDDIVGRYIVSSGEASRACQFVLSRNHFGAGWFLHPEGHFAEPGGPSDQPQEGPPHASANCRVQFKLKALKLTKSVPL